MRAEMDSDPMYLSFLSPLHEPSGLFTTILLFFWPHQAAWGSLFPDQELNLRSLGSQGSPLLLKNSPEEPG